MADFKARLVDKDGNPLGTASNPLKISGGGSGDGTWNGYTRPASVPLYLLRYNADGSAIEAAEPGAESQVNSDWNAATGVASILNKPDINSGVLIQAKNSTAGTLYKGQAVYITPGAAAVPDIALCDNTNMTKSRVFGIVAANLTAGSSGYVQRMGILATVDTRASNTNVNPNGETWVEGDLLFATASGGLTKTRPTSGRSVKVGYSIRGSNAADSILLHPMENPVWVTGAANENVVLRLGDSSGVTKVSIRDYANSEVAWINSDGVSTFARSTTAALAILVTKDALLAGDTTTYGSNIYTTIQAAIASLPAIIAHAVTIFVRKGSTPYAENVVLNRTVSGGSIAIRGEYYWAGTNASSLTGKITLSSGATGYSNRAKIEAGDRVCAIKWSGTIEASAPSETIYDTVASVSDAEVTLTTNSSKAFDTTWTFIIVKSEISPASGYGITITNTDAVAVNALIISGTPTRSFEVTNARNMTIGYCYLTGFTYSGIVIYKEANGSINRSFVNTAGNSTMGVYIDALTYVSFAWGAINLTGSSTYGGYAVAQSYLKVVYSHIDAAATGLYALTGSEIWRNNILNDGTTPINPASSPSSDGSYIV